MKEFNAEIVYFIIVKVGQHIGALDYLLPEEYVNTMKVILAPDWLRPQNWPLIGRGRSRDLNADF